MREEAELATALVPRRFEVSFGTERAAPELQAGSTWATSALGEDRPHRRRPVQCARDRPGLQVGQAAFSAAKIQSELRLQIPLYMLVLRDLVGIEPLGGVYRALAGERDARGLLREEARDDLPGFQRATT